MAFEDVPLFLVRRAVHSSLPCATTVIGYFPDGFPTGAPGQYVQPRMRRVSDRGFNRRSTPALTIHEARRRPEGDRAAEGSAGRQPRRIRWLSTCPAPLSAACY